MIHRLSGSYDIPERFNDPFRYSPHPMVTDAACEIMERIGSSKDLAEAFAEGKMLGVLVVRDESGCIGYLAGFSGNVGGRSIIDGFVPPIFDLTRPGGYYRTNEEEISVINEAIARLDSSEYRPLLELLQKANTERDAEIAGLRNLKHDTIAESQFRNAEIKRAKDRWKATIAGLETKAAEIGNRLSSLKKERAGKSDELQKWIFNQYVVMNASGETASILEIFQRQGLTPPGGTGDCAAPKLLDYAYRHGLEPIAMGEFWYGKSPATAVRTHGHFYPSCTSKCGPLLSYMMRGLEPSAPHRIHDSMLKAEVIYEDEAIIVVDKPSGMPSVPGLDGRTSLQEWIIESHRDQLSGNVPDIRAVHRLDMDTSGLIIFAKTEDAEINLKKQFEEHTVRKTYMAGISPADTHTSDIPVLKAGDKGRIELPLSADYDERPRQKVDMAQGKPSLTEYEVVSVNEDGTTDILFYPHTGRTHQLRVHSAHILGLGRPILGDMLYGGCGNAWSDTGSDSILHLHAYSITFRHPVTGTLLTLKTEG